MLMPTPPADQLTDDGESTPEAGPGDRSRLTAVDVNQIAVIENHDLTINDGLITDRVLRLGPLDRRLGFFSEDGLGHLAISSLTPMEQRQMPGGWTSVASTRGPRWKAGSDYHDTADAGAILDQGPMASM